MVKAKKKYFKTEYIPAGIFLSVNVNDLFQI
jgi:hypothetical protein